MIVGLPDKTVGESRERVRASFGLALPPGAIDTFAALDSPGAALVSDAAAEL